jgi:predicted phage terminase large subunit-like protein
MALDNLLSLRTEVIDAELQRRARASLRAFIAYSNPKFEFYDHCELLIDILEDVAKGRKKRVMIFLPPRHSKSEMVSRLFSAYYVHHNPSHFVGLTSYSAQLAFTLSRAARSNFTKCGGRVREDAGSVSHWETPEGGGMWAAGVGGSITGKGGHLLIVDDPLRNSEDASSELIREKQKEWYSSTFETRAEPNAAILIIQTRWHEDDLAGWLLEQEKIAEPEEWHIVCLPGLSEPLEDYGFPDTCTIEKDFRIEEGIALCPERYDEKFMLRRRSKNSYTFDALYQQRPSSKEGLFFHVNKMEIVDAAPAIAKRVRGWDMAATKDSGDFTVGSKVSAANGIFYIEDIRRGQWDTATRDGHIKLTANLDGRPVSIIGEQEGGSGGKSAAEAFIKNLAGFIVTTERATGSKESRAEALSSQINAGNVKLVRGDWNVAFIEELRKFPNGKHDDQVDATSLAFNQLSKTVDVSEAERRMFEGLRL